MKKEFKDKRSSLKMYDSYMQIESSKQIEVNQLNEHT